MAQDAKHGLALKIVAGATSVTGLGIFAYKQAGLALSDIDTDHPGPLITIGAAVLMLATLAAWRWSAHRRGLSGRIRRRD